MDSRLLIDELDATAAGRVWNGSWNMAVDEVLLAGAAAHGRATLRFYGWNEPTVSLGYFQRVAERGSHPPSQMCRWVRRVTGGGAIVHDQDLTYSYTFPASRQTRGAAEGLYDAFHETLMEALAEWSIFANRCAAARESSPSEWLCFRRHTSADVLIGNAKICGSAQRRHEGGVLQHGSVLLATSKSAPELPGIAELTGKSLVAGELATAWLERLSRRLGTQFSQEAICIVESTDASRIQFNRFDSPAWNEKR